MRFTDQETEEAIRIVRAVREESGTPLLSPDEMERLESAAAEGDRDAYARVITAKLRLLYPVVPLAAEKSAHSGTDMLWQSIMDGRLEGIRMVESLDYRRAWEDIQNGRGQTLGSYLERWQSSRLKNEIMLMCAEGWPL